MLIDYAYNRAYSYAYNRADGQPTRNGRKIYYLPRIDLKKKKVMIGKGEDYTTGSLLDFNYFSKHYKLVAADLSKQKELDADPRAIQQIEFKYMLGTNSTIY